MKFIYPIITLILSGISSSLFAATLIVPPDVRLFVVDGVQNPPQIAFKEQTIPFVDGQHQILVKVEKTIDTGNHDQEIYKSKPIIINFTATSSQTLTLTLPPLTNTIEAKRFEKNPVLMIKDQNNQSIPTQQDILPLKGLIILANLEDELAKYNVSKGKAAIPAFSKQTAIGNNSTSIPVTTTAITTHTAVTLKGQTAEEEMLQYWYQRADEASRQRFLAWVKQQKES